MKPQSRLFLAAPSDPSRGRLVRTVFYACAGLGAALLAGGCGGGGSGGGTDSGLVAGALVENPDPAVDTYFVVEKGQGGNGQVVKIRDVYWGRLVTIQDYDVQSGDTTVLFRNFVIGDNIVNDGINYRLDRDPVTEEEALTILHKFGTPEFTAAFQAADANLQVMLKKSLAVTEVPPFTAVPRNAALVIAFDDLLNDGGNPGDPGYPGSISASTLRMLVGNPIETPYEARILPDPCHGDLVGTQFHTTRVIIDLTVSENEALDPNAPATLPVNALGLPEADSVSVANGVVRIPTAVEPTAQQFEILTNLGGRGVSSSGNGPTEPTASSLHVVRAFRSMGKTEITGDPNNGFLPDEIAPVLLGAQVITAIVDPFTSGPFGVNGDEFIVDVHFELSACAIPPRIGDVLDLLPDYRAQVIAPFTGTISGGTAPSVGIRLIRGDPALFQLAGNVDGQFKTTFDPTAGHDPRCFVRFLPTEGTPPASDVALNASMVVTFSEPIDPASVQAFDTLTVRYDTPPSSNLLYSNVIGHIVPSQDLREFTFVPELYLRHTLGQADGYTLEVIGGASGITDLAGNPLVNALTGATAVPFKVDDAAASFDSGSISLKFNATDEDVDGAPEVRGQLFYDLDEQAIRPRAAVRFSQVADPSVPTVGVMIPINAPIQTPLSDKGSKMMGVWRYHDLSFGMLEDSTHNLDIEGLSWTLYFSGLFPDNFSRFQMSFAHSKYLPDEELSSGLLPNYPASGLVGKFEDNLLDKTSDPLTIVHPAAKGYTVGGSPDDTFFAPTSGFTMAHWPLNRGVEVDQYTYWTWRDTAKINVAAPNGAGADTQRLQQVTKLGNTGFYVVGKVPTIALPLLMEYRTWPDTNANGSNGFRIAIAVNSSANPYFRAFSTGGVLQSGQVVTVDPEAAITAAGGINPATGQTTFPRDNAFYYGQADFVVRVSRVHTVWFDTLGASQFITPVVEPSPSNLPTGTQIVLAFRGASSITFNAGTPGWRDATILDPYGDSYTTGQLTVFQKPSTWNFTPTFFHLPPLPPNPTTDKSWKSSLQLLNGARYFQVRATFLANPETMLTPELSALGFAYFR